MTTPSPVREKVLTFRPDNDTYAAMAALRVRDGVPFSEQIRRALRAWLRTRGILIPEEPYTVNVKTKLVDREPYTVAAEVRPIEQEPYTVKVVTRALTKNRKNKKNKK